MQTCVMSRIGSPAKRQKENKYTNKSVYKKIPIETDEIELKLCIKSKKTKKMAKKNY